MRKKIMLEETVAKIEPKEEAEKTKWDKILLLLYPDSSSYNCSDILKNIETDHHVKSYAYILHDDDYFTEETFDKHGRLLGHKGEKKKNHYHCVISFSSRKTKSDISMWLSVPQNHIEKCKDFDDSLLYLMHRNAEDKTPYPMDKVHTNIYEYIEYLYDNYVPQLNPIPLLYKYLDEVKYPTFRGYIKYLGADNVKCSLKYWGIIRDIIKEVQSDDINRQTLIDKQIKYEEMKRDALANLLRKFGKVNFTDENGKVTQYTLNDKGEIDLLGYTVGGNK